MTNAEKVQYWIDLSDRDLDTAEYFDPNKGFTAMDKTEDIIATARKYADLVKASNLPIQIDKAYLFGSFAKGTPRKDSDIDIAFVVSKWEGGYFDTVVPMWRLRRNIDVRIEPHIIDPNEDYAYFLREIERTGILIN